MDTSYGGALNEAQVRDAYGHCDDRCSPDGARRHRVQPYRDGDCERRPGLPVSYGFAVAVFAKSRTYLPAHRVVVSARWLLGWSLEGHHHPPRWLGLGLLSVTL